MTTDNKTLADVQPGGRVRLGDQLVLAKLVGSAGLMLAEIDTCGHEVDPAYRRTLYEAWEEGKAALSAQPSPGGPGAPRCAEHCQNGFSDICLASQRDGVICPEDSCDIDDGIRHNHLAARHPVTMDDALAAGDSTLHGAIDHWQERALRAEAELAARQPVGEPDEPIFQVKHHDDTEATWRDATEAAYEMQPAALRRIVYAAPPAQAVDLGQFVPDPKTVPDCFAEDDSDAQYNSGWNDCRDAVLALIDSQAVGIKEWLEAASRSALSRMDALMKALRAYGAASMTIGGSPLSKRDYYEAQTRRDLAWNEVKAIAESMAEDLQISRTAQAVAHDPSVDSQAVGK